MKKYRVILWSIPVLLLVSMGLIILKEGITLSKAIVLIQAVALFFCGKWHTLATERLDEKEKSK